MNPSPEKNNPVTARRRAAEAQLEKQNESRPPQSEADLRRLLHELEVHQIELEMQSADLRAAHAEINAGLERYTELFEFAPAGYFNLTADGTIRLVNLTGATLLNHPRAQLLGKRLNVLVVEGDRKIFSDFLTRVFAGLESETCWVQLAPDGRPTLFVRLDAKCAAEGDHCRVVMLDITDRHRAEEALLDTDRALQTVTACNRVLVRAKSEPEMLREICRAIIEPGGYRMAWIGFVEPDESKSMRVVAQAGFEEGYLEKAKINWREDNVRGQGPSGIAYRTGEIVVCNDFQTDPTTGPWRAEAAVRGYGSSISLPLKYANECFGVMMIYAGLTNAFQNKERQLLAELADDLGYGLNVLRAAQRHAVAEAALAASEARFRTLFSEHAAAQWVIDVETGIIVDANAAAARFYGWPVAQLKGMRVADINTQGEAAVHRVIQKVHAKEQFHFEFQHRRADGSVRDVEIFSNEMVIEGKPLLYSIIHDITERKRAEEALKLGEEKFRNLFNHAEAGMFRSRLDGSELLEANDKYLAILGVTGEEVLGKPAILLWADPAEREAMVNQLKAEGKVIDYECRLLNRAGEVRTCLTSMKLYPETGILEGSIVDITERKQAEEKIRSLAGELKLILDTAPIGIAWLKDRQVVTANLTHDKIFGYAPGETVCLPMHRFYADPEDYARVGREGYAALARGETFRAETLMRRQDGSVFPCSLTGQAINPQNLDDGSIWQLEDITERKRVEESLRLLSSAVLQTKDSIIITDAELNLPGPRIIFVNPAFTKMTGYTAEEVIGKTPRILQGPKTDKTLLRRLRQNLERGEVFEGEGINYRKDGKEFDLEWQIAPIRNASGIITHFVAIQRDLTDRKKLEAQFLQSQKMEAVGQLAGGVAHDLNNILAAQYFEIDLLPMTEPVSPGVRKGLEHIRDSAERAAKMVSQLLLYSRRQLMQMRDVDLNPVVDNFSKLLRRLIGEQIQFEIHTHMEPLWVNADSGMIEQVLMNLALNARDAMPKGGKLLIETSIVTVAEGSEPPPREVQPGRYACLSVADTGTGIAPEVLPRIFEPFFTTKDVGKGSGLGLSSVDGIIKQHKGWIDVDNRPGEGVTFRIYFPALTMLAMEPPPNLEPARSLGGTETILLVEDDISVSKLICRLLQQKGYVILVAANGPEALKLWAEQRDAVALLLTDIIMPNGMSGLELAKQLSREKPSLKVVYISGYSNEFAASKLDLREGVNFLQKPFVGQQLLKTIRENLDKPAQA